ncbi:MAG TPA: 6-phosphogluconolactonase [Terriglobales bacterium]|nr:6-phosphogluconolactonase [Terriglobales bacterium]HUL14618.1 6-phosphogluconolactonase [Terriglobales bacterium]
MIFRVFANKLGLGEAAAEHAAGAIQSAIGQRGCARMIAASAASQLEFLAALTRIRGIAWKNVELFHLDEYLGLPPNHPASLARFLQEHLITRTGIRKYHLLDGTQEPDKLIHAAGTSLTSAPIDVAFVGIGENGHLAFNDPPADFVTEEPYLLVKLDETSRRQQVREGWFQNLSEVPERAISMSVRQILKSSEIIAIVPDSRKAEAVKACFSGEISPMAPASILRTHPRATVYLDTQSAALLDPLVLSKYAS